MGDETEVIHIEENGDEGHDVRVGKGEVGVVSLDRVDEVGDVESPRKGGKTTVFGDTFEDLNVGVIVGEDVEDSVHEGVVEGVESLSEVRGDVILM